MTRRGLLLFVAMSLIWGIPYLFIRIAVSELTPATLVFLRTAVAALVLIPIAVRRGGFRDLSGLPAVSVNAAALALCAVEYAPLAAFQWPRTIPSIGVLASVAVLALVCSALGFLIFFALVAEIGPVRATVITYINPAVAAVAGILVLHENLTMGMGIGFILVLAGSTLATRRASRRQVGLVEEPITVRDR
jgi:drug/metabolite transporter (DMT)-like permease